MFQRILIIAVWILALLLTASAQPRRRKTPPLRPATAPASDTQLDQPAPHLTDPTGWVWVTQTIDLSQQLGGEENIFTLDGEPPSFIQRKRVSLGLVIDNDGHIVTRLIDVAPSTPPLEVRVRADGSRPVRAQFLGMDTVTGLCVLKAEDTKLRAALFADDSLLPPRLNIRLYSFHPHLRQNTSALLTLDSPRRNFYPGQIVKATSDFRYNANNPLYYLLSPQLTPVQDCSLIFAKANEVFGLAIYDTGSEGKHLVYPIARVRAIAEAIIKSHQSIAHGWLGATGRDVYAPILTATHQPEITELGMRVTAVAPDSPAEQAGVKVTDVIIGINDRRIETYAQLATAIRQLPAHSEVALRIKRGNEYKLLKAKLAPAPSTEPEQQIFAFVQRLEAMKNDLKALPSTDPNRQRLEGRVNAMALFVNAVTSPAPPEIRLRVFYGFEVQPLTGQLMNYFAVTNGLLVTSVTEASKVARAGLQAGDIITKVSAQEINSMAVLIKALDSANTETIEMTVSRRRETLQLSFPR